MNTSTYADDLEIVINNIIQIQPQINKLRLYSDLAHMDLGITKYVVTRCPYNSKLQPLAFTTYLKAQNIHYKNQPLPMLSQNDPYTYLGIWLVPLLKWSIQKETSKEGIKRQSATLLLSLASIQQKIKILNFVILPMHRIHILHCPHLSLWQTTHQTHKIHL